MEKELTFSGVLLLANRMQSTYDAALGDITLKQWLALVVLLHIPEPAPSTAQLAETLGTTHQNATKLVAALERKGMVERRPSNTDARAREIHLTAAAHEQLQQHVDFGTRMLTQLFDGIPDADVATCLGVLNRMSINLTGDSILPPETER